MTVGDIEVEALRIGLDALNSGSEVGPDQPTTAMWSI